MTTSLNKTFNLIDSIYSGKPFIDETGQVTVVPNVLDRLIDSICLYERFFYEHPEQVSSQVQTSFLEKTKNFISTISIDKYKEEIRDLEYSSREVILRTLDKLVQEYPDCIELNKYRYCTASYS